MTESHTSAVRADLEPPKESRTSIVLNSVGNGMMLGGIPLLAIEGYNTFRPINKIPPKIHFATIAAAVVGGVLGWTGGVREAERTEKHKEAIAKEVTQLRQDVETLKAEKRNWQERIQDASPEASSTPILS